MPFVAQQTVFCSLLSGGCTVTLYHHRSRPHAAAVECSIPFHSIPFLSFQIIVFILKIYYVHLLMSFIVLSSLCGIYHYILVALLHLVCTWARIQLLASSRKNHFPQQLFPAGALPYLKFAERHKALWQSTPEAVAQTEIFADKYVKGTPWIKDRAATETCSG